jgi:hypothetical protein
MKSIILCFTILISAAVSHAGLTDASREAAMAKLELANINQADQDFEVSSNCLNKAIEEANERAVIFINKNKNVLNEQDIATILKDLKIVARIEARTCAILESKQN